MKKKYLSLLALPLLMASCAEDIDVFGGATDGTLPISFTLGTPSGMNTTRGTSDQGAFDNIDWNEYDLRYQLEVYETSGANPTSGDLVTTRRVRTVNKEGAITIDDIRLTPNRQYTFVVWADLVNEGSTADLHYNTNVGEATVSGYEGLQNITIKNWGINDETRDAYFIVQTQTVTSADPISLTLKRPFAKLRVVTTDVEHLKLYTYPNFTKVAYKQGPARPSTFNALTGVASGELALEAGAAPVQYDGESAKDGQTNGLNENLDKTLFVDYIFAKEGEQTAVQFDLSAYEGVDASTRLIRTYEFSTDIPVQRNYLTTIKGNVLTNGTEFEISVDDAFAGKENIDVWDGKTVTEPQLVNGYYEIANAAQWVWLRSNKKSGNNIKLIANIDFGGFEVTGMNFSGTIEGQGHTMSNMVLLCGASYYSNGLLCPNPNAGGFTVKNLTISNVEAECAAPNEGYVGTIIGDIQNSQTVNLENVHVIGANLCGVQSIGGLVGLVASGCTANIKDCSVQGSYLHNYAVANESGFVNGFAGKVVGTVNFTGNNSISGTTIDAYYAPRRTENSISLTAAVYSSAAGTINGAESVDVSNNNTVKRTELLGTSNVKTEEKIDGVTVIASGEAAIVVDENTTSFATIPSLTDDPNETSEGIYVANSTLIGNYGISSNQDKTYYFDNVTFDCEKAAISIDNINSVIVVNKCNFIVPDGGKVAVTTGSTVWMYITGQCQINGVDATASEIQALCENVYVSKNY